MKNMMLIILILIIALILFVFGLFAYLDVLGKIEVTEKEMGPYKIVYVENKGDYKKVSVAMDEVYEKLKSKGIVTYKGIGIYYDNPKEVAAENLRSDIGNVIEIDDYEKLGSVKLPEKYKSKEIERTQYVVVEFPLKNSLSYMAGVIRVYPVLSKYQAEKNYKSSPIIELYDVSGKKIYYILSIKK